MPVFIERHPANHGLVDETAVALIDIQDRRRLIAGHINIGKSIAVEVAGENSEGVIGAWLRNTAAVGDVAKQSILVVVKDIAIERQAARTATHRNAAIEAIWIGARFRCRGKIEFQIVGDEEIELAVVVVIDKRAASVISDTILSQVGRRRDVFKMTAACIAIENILAPVRDEEIGVAIVIVILPAHTPCPHPSCVRPRAAVTSRNLPAPSL